MKKKQVYTLVFISITLGFVFILAYLFLVLANTDGYSSAAFEGLSVVLCLVVLAELAPVFILLYIAAAMILKEHYRQEKSIGGNMLLTIAMLADCILWYGWAHGSVRSDAMRPLFIPAIAIGIGIFLLLSLVKFSPESKQDQ